VSKYSSDNRSLNFYFDINVWLLQTVNTSARMESNGEPNKIHVSAATAELLQTEGKRYVAGYSLLCCRLSIFTNR
jgi:class 3 adenylate cyclase